MDDDVAGLADGEPPSPSPTPPIRIRLHDGQEVTGRLLHRWQGSTGAWFYRVSVTLWASTQFGGRDLPEPADVEFDAPQTHVDAGRRRLLPGRAADPAPRRDHPRPHRPQPSHHRGGDRRPTGGIGAPRGRGTDGPGRRRDP